MPKDFSDAKKGIIVMPRGTDGEFQFIPTLDDGTTIAWDQYDVVCEGRLSIASADYNFLFPVSFDNTGLTPKVTIAFPKAMITDSIRESKVYWKVLATKTADSKTILLNYGEIWLEG